jgi:hypothetical protein
MAVIINDFEIVSEPPPSEERGSGDQQENQAAQAQGPKPHEIEHVIERQRERRARVWAH